MADRFLLQASQTSKLKQTFLVLDSVNLSLMMSWNSSGYLESLLIPEEAQVGLHVFGVIGQFFLEVMKESGEFYPPNSLYSLCCGLQCTPCIVCVVAYNVQSKAMV